MGVKSSIIILILCICCNLAVTQLRQFRLQDGQQPQLSSVDIISKGSELFALDLFKRISDAVSSQSYDFMISPFSIWSLLLLIAEGASGNTLDQLQQGLNIPNLDIVRNGFSQIQKALNVNTSTIDASSFQVLISDLAHQIRPEYENLIKNSYGANFMSIDFQNTRTAPLIINNYVNQSTRGLIDFVVDEDDLKQAQLILISTIFFKGQWKHPFNQSLTKSELFFDDNGIAIGSVNMMFQRGIFPLAPITAIDAHVLELPYGNENRLSMLILLPRKGASVNSVVAKLADYKLRNIFAELQKNMQQFDDDEVEIYLPKFSTTSDFVLNVILEQMGIRDLFDSYKANLSKASNKAIFLSRVFHKAKIEVNEEGTVASAATFGVFSNKASPTRFVVNRPFAYLIIEKSTGSLLFCGQVTNPMKV